LCHISSTLSEANRKKVTTQTGEDFHPDPGPVCTGSEVGMDGKE